MILIAEEMTTQRELSTASENSLAAFVTNALPDSATAGDNKENEKDDEQKFDSIKHSENNGHSSDMLVRKYYICVFDVFFNFAARVVNYYLLYFRVKILYQTVLEVCLISLNL